MFRGPHARNTPRQNAVAPKTQTTSPLAARFQRFSPRWSAFWALHHPKPRPRRHQAGGIARHGGPTRRRHAARRLRVVQNPIATGVEGTKKPQDRNAAPALVPGPAPDNFACNSKTQVTQRHRSIRTSTMPEGNCMRNYYGMGGAGPGCGARGRWRGQGGLRDDAPRPSTHQAPLVWRAPEGSAAVPVGGGGAWPGFETTRRAKLAARTARGRAAAHRHTQRPGPTAPGTPAAPRTTDTNTRVRQRGGYRSTRPSLSHCLVEAQAD